MTPEELIASIAWATLPTLRFEMGSDRLAGAADDDEGPPRDVSVGVFTVSTEPISVEQFSVFVEATGFVTVAEREGTGFIASGGERLLESGRTWRDTTSGPITQVAWDDAFAFCEWAGTRLLTEAEWERAARHGLDSMIGDLLEWCADYYDPAFHRTEQRVNPRGPNGGTTRVARGCSPTARTPLHPDMSSTDLTFRVAQIAKPPSLG